MSPHEVLGEGFTRLEPGGSAAGAHDPEPAALEVIDEAVCERSLWTNYRQIDCLRLGQRYQRSTVCNGNGNALGEVGNPSVPRSAVKLKWLF